MHRISWSRVFITPHIILFKRKLSNETQLGQNGDIIFTTSVLKKYSFLSSVQVFSIVMYRTGLVSSDFILRVGIHHKENIFESNLNLGSPKIIEILL